MITINVYTSVSFYAANASLKLNTYYSKTEGISGLLHISLSLNKM
jgi:hypothetical protein